MPGKFLDESRMIGLSDSDIANAVRSLGINKAPVTTVTVKGDRRVSVNREYSISDVLDMIIDHAQIISAEREVNEIR